jgi:hypothetical protein
MNRRREPNSDDIASASQVALSCGRPRTYFGHSEDISWPRSKDRASPRGEPQRRYRRGNAAANVPHAGRDPRGRAARVRSVPAESGQGHEPPFARPGGRRRRLRRRHAPGRPVVLHLSRPRPHAGARRADREGAGRADAARHRADARQGRLDASDLGRSRRDGLLRHHRRASADRLRRGVARAIQGRRRTYRSASSATAPPISAPSTRR